MHYERLHDSCEVWLRVYCAAISNGADAPAALSAADLAVPIYVARFQHEERPLPDPPGDPDGLMMKGL